MGRFSLDPSGLPWNWNLSVSIIVVVELSLYWGVKVLPDTEKFRPLGLIVELPQQSAGDELLPQFAAFAIDALSARASELAISGVKKPLFGFSRVESRLVL